MKKSGLVYISAILTVLSGCSTAKPSQGRPELTAASQCSEQIHTASKNKKGTTTLKSLQDNSTFLKVGDSSQERYPIQGAAYVESTFLDKGNPGSAWRNCMQIKGFIISQ